MIDISSVGEWLATETRNAGPDTAVLAGHFAIFSAGGAAGDLLGDEPAPPAGAAEMIEFTRFTWKVACDVAATQPASAFRLVTLVDDIQFVRPVNSDRSLAERLGAALARDYLETVRELPGYHARELANRQLGEDRIVRYHDDRWLFSERELRHAAVRHVRQHYSDGGGGSARLTSSDNGNTMTVTLAEQGDYCLVHSGHTTCAGGYVELLSTLFARGVRRLIAFIPMRCFGQVSLGTELAQSLFALSGLEVVNVAVPDLAVASSVVVDRNGGAQA